MTGELFLHIEICGKWKRVCMCLCLCVCVCACLCLCVCVCVCVCKLGKTRLSNSSAVDNHVFENPLHAQKVHKVKNKLHQRESFIFDICLFVTLKKLGARWFSEKGRCGKGGVEKKIAIE